MHVSETTITVRAYSTRRRVPPFPPSCASNRPVTTISDRSNCVPRKKPTAKTRQSTTSLKPAAPRPTKVTLSRVKKILICVDAP